MDAEKVYDALEGYRPGQLETPGVADQAIRDQLLEDDVLQAQFEKSQALDQQLTEVFADVPVPAGLRERLQKAIASTRISAIVCADKGISIIVLRTEQQLSHLERFMPFEQIEWKNSKLIKTSIHKSLNQSRIVRTQSTGLQKYGFSRCFLGFFTRFYFRIFTLQSL